MHMFQWVSGVICLFLLSAVFWEPAFNGVIFGHLLCQAWTKGCLRTLVDWSQSLNNHTFTSHKVDIIIYTTRLYASWFLSLKHFPFRMLPRVKQAAVGRSAFSFVKPFQLFQLKPQWNLRVPGHAKWIFWENTNKHDLCPLRTQLFANDLPQLYTTTSTKYHSIIYQLFDMLILFVPFW